MGLGWGLGVSCFVESLRGIAALVRQICVRARGNAALARYSCIGWLANCLLRLVVARLSCMRLMMCVGDSRFVLSDVTRRALTEKVQ